MTAHDQLHMFEPEGRTLAKLVHVHQATYMFETRVAANLEASGFLSAAKSRASIAFDAQASACVCEMALQFEQLSGLQ